MSRRKCGVVRGELRLALLEAQRVVNLLGEWIGVGRMIQAPYVSELKGAIGKVVFKDATFFDWRSGWSTTRMVECILSRGSVGSSLGKWVVIEVKWPAESWWNKSYLPDGYRFLMQKGMGAGVPIERELDQLLCAARESIRQMLTASGMDDAAWRLMADAKFVCTINPYASCDWHRLVFPNPIPNAGGVNGVKEFVLYARPYILAVGGYELEHVTLVFHDPSRPVETYRRSGNPSWSLFSTGGPI